MHPSTSSSMIRLALLVCACMHAHAAARTRAQLAGRDRRRRRRRPAACVPVNGHASIHLFRRPAGGGACRGSTGCRAKRHLNVFLFLSCENPIQRAGRAQSEGGSTVDYWLGSIEQGCNRPVWHGGGASARAVAFRRGYRFRPSCWGSWRPEKLVAAEILVRACTQSWSSMVTQDNSVLLQCKLLRLALTHKQGHD